MLWLTLKIIYDTPEEEETTMVRRAGGNGTAGTAMAVPVFEGEKWRHLDSNLACVMECPLRALRRSLGQLRGLQAFKVATRELRLLNFL